MSTNTDIDEIAWLGAALLAAQKLEFALYGIASHAAHTPAAARDRRFKKLSPEVFLRGDVSQLKATLGGLVTSFGDQFGIRTAELDQYVEHRNLICHNYWRLTRANISGGERLTDPIGFLKEFVERSDRLTSVVSGFLAHLLVAAAKAEGRDFTLSESQHRDMRIYVDYVSRYLSEREHSSR